MLLYKHIAAERIDDILAGKIRFTQPGAFNDPFEMPAFKLQEAAEALKLSGLLDQADNIMGDLISNPLIPSPHAFTLPLYYLRSTPSGNPAINDAETAKSVIEKIKSIDQKFGILSLTATGENLLMWAHYSNEHKGAVIELDIEDPAFQQRAFQEARNMSYTTRRPHLPVNEEVLMDHFFTKSSEWSYEQEFRIVRYLEDHADVKLRDAQFPIYLFDLPNSCIKSLTFGTRFDPTHRDIVCDQIRQNHALKHIHLYQANIDAQEFQLRMSDL